MTTPHPAVQWRRRCQTIKYLSLMSRKKVSMIFRFGAGGKLEYKQKDAWHASKSCDCAQPLCARLTAQLRMGRALAV
jgi:hypothetical protein